MALSSMKMNLDYIRTFAVLGQSRNMTEASRKLGVDTSYVSRHIKQLEEELQTKLVILSTKKKEMQLTEAGKYFFDKYEKIYNEILLTEKNYRQIEHLDNCKVVLGVSLDLENILLKSNLQEFTERFPNISIKIKNGDFEELFHSLLNYSCDFILCKLNEDVSFPSEITIKSLFSTHYCLVYNPECYHYSDMSEASVILPVNNTDERRIINSYFEKNHLKWKRSYEVESFDRMLSYVNDGFGVAFMLKEVAQNDPKLQIIDLDIPVTVAIAYIQDKITPSTLELLKMFL